MDKILHIIGGGLAGSEAAWQAANLGCHVYLYEMRNKDKLTPAHTTDKLAELVCSNSFRNDEINSAIGLLHQEMRLFGSLIMEAAEQTKVPAGNALAMDREKFSEYVTHKLSTHPNITIIRKEINKLPTQDEMNKVIISTGPLTSMNLSEEIRKVSGEENLAFYDAIAPIIYKDTINFDIAWFQSRYDKTGDIGTGKDYINLPLSKEQYYSFIEELLEAEHTEFKDWEKDTKFFDGCLPIEEMAKRGKDTLLFGPMKPVGLLNPHTNERPFAVIQLRQDNELATLYNIVGFQTKLKYADQKRIFTKIPGLENAEFARLGGLHRNTFINSPRLLNETMQFKAMPFIRFAGQMIGVEGYVESASMGMLTGYFSACELLGMNYTLPPKETAIGALLNHVTKGAISDTFQPMNVNFGLFPELGTKTKKADRKEQYAKRALNSFNIWKTSLIPNTIVK